MFAARRLPRLLRLRASRSQQSRLSSTRPPPATRASKILSKLPSPLQKYTTRLRSAPLSHVVAFLILHELTAVIPLFGLFGLFHYTSYTPTEYVTEHWGGYVSDAVRTFERYFKRKGWFGFSAEDATSIDTRPGEGGSTEDTKRLITEWEGADGRYKLLADVALAWAITKVLLPARIVGSLWATPWFAGVLVRGRKLFSGRT
ncbi:uncharacterized protein DNG_08715 [Cephalotrichum gorgonifer]|uniref:Uncharacterized protein n=1 Tax=Cephalotrichum gorgonifer TaxID=2041049 RepID=A0AAE8N432_9PEZI|nr:uncharacterized protein DNG_08715 [Cephalotrichum gorgonifer]